MFYTEQFGQNATQTITTNTEKGHQIMQNLLLKLFKKIRTILPCSSIAIMSHLPIALADLGWEIYETKQKTKQVVEPIVNSPLWSILFYSMITIGVFIVIVVTIFLMIMIFKK